MADWTLRHALKVPAAAFSPPVVVPPDLFPSRKASAKGEPAVCCMPITQCLEIHVLEFTNIFLSNTNAWNTRLVIALS